MVEVPRSSRICSFDRLIIPCRLPTWPSFTLPVAVSLKRFLAPDLVFILGILRLLSIGISPVMARLFKRARVQGSPRHAQPGGPKERALYGKPALLQGLS